MAIYVKDLETEAAVRGYAARRQLSVTAAIRQAIAEAERHETIAAEQRYQRRLRSIRAIQAELARLPVLDDRSPEEILGYDEDGLPN